MDIIELLKQHQIALMKAGRPDELKADDRSNDRRTTEVRDYEKRIKSLRNDLGVHQY